MLNQWVGIGRLCEDPSMRYTTGGKAVANLRLAVDNGTNNGEKDTLFCTVVCWEKLAETVGQYLAKGRLVAVSGKWTNRNYEKDGKRHTAYEVVANRVDFLDRAPDGDSGNRTTGGPAGGGFSDDDPPFAPCP
jgi:single-strand DNA-binding protein